MTVQTLNILCLMLSDPFAERYGLELSEQAGIKTGTLYPTLARLEVAGWLSSAWEDIDPRQAGRPRRRLYRLTADGADAARLAVDQALAQMATNRSPSTRIGVRRGVAPA